MTSLPTTTKINGYFIFESLEDDRTTIAIGKVIDGLRDKDLTQFYYVKIKNKEHLINGIRKIKDADNLFPLIHIAAHGNEDGTGIKLLEDEILWPEFTKELSEMNTRAKNTTILIMALCKGALIMTEFFNTIRSPYFLMIGPRHDINWNKLDRCLFEFYKILIPTYDLGKAFEEIPKYNGGFQPFDYLNSVGAYQKLVSKFKEKINEGQFKHELLNRYKEIEGKKADSEFKRKVEEIEYQKEIISKSLEIMKNHWFMIDLYPENAERFKNLDTKIE
jgi:hypothetical protein